MNKDLTKICLPQTFESVFKKYGGDLKRFIYLKAQDRDVTEDILQDTFVKLWENCDSVKFETVKGYLYKVATNLFLNMVKHKKVVWAHQQKPSRDSTNESPEFIMLEKEFLEKIESAIANLPETQREAFLLSRIEKKKYKEISEMLNISVKAVEKRMHLALKSIKHELGNF